MSNETYFISRHDWEEFLRILSRQAELWGLVSQKDRIVFVQVKPTEVDRLIYNGIRSAQPVKTMFYPGRDKLTALNTSKKIIVGMKACDLGAMPLYDQVFLRDGLVDSFYQALKENIILVSADCTEPGTNCFCTVIGLTPFAAKEFDLNISQIAAGLLVETGSGKGKELIKTNQALFKNAESGQIAERDKNRQNTSDRVKEINKEFNLSFDRTVKEHFDSPVWEKEAQPCVGCTACTNVCPTCHCFLLAEADPETLSKIRLWDSCQYTGFARVAGGANPRAKLAERFKNRYYCKYYYRPTKFNQIACTGCGRCIEACLGKIDKRKVIRELGR